MARKAEQRKIDEAIRKIREIARAAGITGKAKGDISMLAKALDQQGHKTPSGGQWHHGKGGPLGLTRFMKQHMPEGIIVEQEQPTTDNVAPTTQETPMDIPQSTPHEVGIKKGSPDTPKEVEDTTPKSTDNLPQDTIPEVDREDVLRDTTEGVASPTCDQPRDTPDMVSGESEPDQNATTPDHKPTTDTKAEDIPQHTDGVVRPTASLTNEELKTMRQIIEWWQTGGQKTMQRLTSVPVEDLKARQTFPGKRTNSGIRINDRLFRAAVKKAKRPEEAQRTGGSLSSLIEVLLWGYLDHDAKYLQPEPMPTTDEPDNPTDDSTTE